MVDHTVRRVAAESSVSVVMDRRCSARRVKRTRDPGPERLGKESAPPVAGASAPQGAPLHTCPLLLREDTHIARHAPGSQSFSGTPGLADPFGFPGGESKVAKIGRFVPNKRNHGFESIPLRQRILISAAFPLNRPN
jgi:hypothetical protein